MIADVKFAVCCVVLRERESEREGSLVQRVEIQQTDYTLICRAEPSTTTSIRVLVEINVEISNIFYPGKDQNWRVNFILAKFQKFSVLRAFIVQLYWE